MPKPIKCEGGHLGLPNGAKNPNLIEDVNILLPVKYHLISFNGWKGEVKNVKSKRRAEDGQGVITILYLSLRLRCTKRQAKESWVYKLK